jgi:hypothetical protein
MLAILTMSRTAVAFQFQSITPLFSRLHDALAFNETGFGMLLGCYMAPGALVAIASPSFVRNYGALRTVCCALIVMGASQIGLMLSVKPELAYLMRMLGGAGGCVVYIVTVDMVAGLKTAAKMSSRMGIVASSWPLGNALSLVLIGGLVSASMIETAAYVPAVFAILMALLVASMSPRPKSVQAILATSDNATRISSEKLLKEISLNEWKKAFASTLIPGVTFALYNVSFVVFSSFTPALLQTQGYTLAAASSIGSLPMWIFVVSVPAGGILAGRSRLGDKYLVGLGCLGGGACMALSYFFEDKVLWYTLSGLLGGLPTGAMLAGAARNRQALFFPALFCIFFIFLLVFPPVLGALISFTGQMHSILVCCIALLVTAFLLFCREKSQ